MTLTFSASQLLWQTYENTSDRLNSDQEQNDALKSFVNALYRSHGSNEQVTDKQVDTWFRSGNHSFFKMLKPLLGELKARVSLASLDAVMLAHWTHDTVIGHSVTNAVLHELQSDNAFAIAVSDHGISSSWLALSLIEDYLVTETEDKRVRSALLLVADQHCSLHHSTQLKKCPALPCAGVLLLQAIPEGVTGKVAEKITFNGYEKIVKPSAFSFHQLRTCYAPFFTDTEQALPLCILTTKDLGAKICDAGLRNNETLYIWDESMMSVAPWALLKACVKPGMRYLFIQEENESFFIAAFVSGDTACI